MAERGAISPTKEDATDDRPFPTDIPGTRKYATLSSVKSLAKCTQSRFLLCVLTIGQVFVLMLFSVWTVKGWYIRYHSVYVVTTVHSSSFDRHNQSMRNTSHQSNTSDHRHHLYRISSKATDYLDKERTDNIDGNSQKLNTQRNKQFRVVGTTNFELVSFTLNWFESLDRLNLKFNVTLIAEDERAYEILSRRTENSSQLDLTQLISGRRTQGARIAGLSSSDCDVILGILEKGTDVVRIAPDTVWLKDPMPLLWQKYDKCDLWITFGAIRTQSLSLAYMKASPNVIAYVKALKKQMKNSSTKVLTHTMALKLGLVALQCKVRLCYLGDNQFPSENHVFEDKGTWYNAHREGIYVVRTGAILDTAQKQYSLERKRLWYLRYPYSR